MNINEYQDKALLLDAPVYEHYRTQPYSDAICHLIGKHKPEGS